MRLLPILVLKTCPWVGACLCSLHASKWLWWNGWIWREQMTVLPMIYRQPLHDVKKEGLSQGLWLEPSLSQAYPKLDSIADISWVRPYLKRMGQTPWDSAGLCPSIMEILYWAGFQYLNFETATCQNGVSFLLFICIFITNK